MEFDDEAQPKGLDLPRLAAAVYAHKRWIVLPTLAAFVAALGFVALVKPRYTGTAKVLLENGESYFTRPEKAQPDVAEVIDDLTVQSEAEAAKSTEVERLALKKMKPADIAEFTGGGGWLSMFGERSDDDPEARLIEAFNRRVDVYPQTKTRVLIFEFTSSDRARAARGADALAEAFLESQRNAKDNEAKTASKWLSEQIDSLRERVATAEGRVEALRAQSGLLAGPNGLPVPSQQLSEISAQIASARAAEGAATAKANALKELVRSGRLDDVGSVGTDDSMRRYAESRVALKSQIAELGRTLLPGHPRMKELAGQLAGLDDEIRKAALKRVYGFEQDARIAASQVKSLQQDVANQAKTVTSSDADQVKLRELEIDAKQARDQLESYLTKYREATARNAENATPADGRIIAAALTPSTPTFPKTGPTLLLAPLAAFFVSLGLTVAKILLTDAGMAPPVRAQTRRVEPDLPFGIDAPAPPPPEESPRESLAWTTAVESFVDKLVEASEGESLPIMVVAEGAAGTLPVALAAARRLARRGAAVLVDLGPSPTWLPDMFDRAQDHGDAAAGLSDLVALEGDFEGAVHRDLSTTLDIIPSGVGEVDAGVLSSVFEALSQDYTFVIVHAPDWRAEAAKQAAADMAALIVSAPSEEIAGVEARVRAAFHDEPLAIKAIGMGAPIEAQDRAA
jgi:polysaccharide biosynthesis transport protein